MTDALDQAALEQLYVRLERPVYNVVYRYLWQAQDAQDVVHDAFVRLWRMRAQVRPESVEPLVYRIAVNLAKNRLRWRKVRGWFGMSDVDGLVGTCPTADTVLAEHAQALQVKQAVDALPDDLREVVLLCTFSGLTQAEIGAMVGVPAGTVASRRHRALGLLRTALQERGGAHG